MDQPPHADAGPGLDIKANRLRVRAMFAGHVIADTVGAFSVAGQGQEPVPYFPPNDVDTSRFGITGDRCTLNGLGQASYCTLVMEGEIQERAAWQLDSPAEGAEYLRDYVAFDPAAVETYELSPEDVALMPRAAHPHSSTA